MTTINAQKAGLALGGMLGLWHLVWSLLVMFGFAQALLNFIFQLHMIMPPYTVGPFSFGLAVSLIIVTSVVGYVFGWVFATIWNSVQGK